MIPTRLLRVFVIYCFFACAGIVIYYAMSSRDGDLLRYIWPSLAPLVLWAIGGRAGPGQLGK